MRTEIYNSDCVVGMRLLPAGCADVTVTSPPYNNGTKYATYRDNRDPAEYLSWCQRWGREIQRLLKPDGSFFLVVGGSSANPLLPHVLAVRFGTFFQLQNSFAWIKSISIGVRSHGHFKPVNSERFVNSCHEHVFHFTKDGRVPLDRLSIGVAYQDKSNVRRWARTAGRDRRCRGSTWFIPYTTIQSREEQRPHPATFPVMLAEYCLRLHGLSQDLCVLDPFMGIGSTGLAAKASGAGHFIGFDIDPDYFDHAKRSLTRP